MNTHIHHIVPKHMGGNDSHNNLIELSVEDHAWAHVLLYMQYENEYDRIAFQALFGQISFSDAAKEAHRLGASKGGNAKKPKNSDHTRRRNLERSKEEYSEMGKKISNAKKGKRVVLYQYEITTPDGSTKIVDDIISFCKQHNLKSSGRMYSAAKTGKAYKGYKCVKLGRIGTFH